MPLKPWPPPTRGGPGRAATDRIPRRRGGQSAAHRRSVAQPHALPDLRRRAAVGRVVHSRDAAAPTAAIPPLRNRRRQMSFQAYLDNIKAKTGKTPVQTETLG